MSQNLSSTAVVIGVLTVNSIYSLGDGVVYHVLSAACLSVILELLPDSIPLTML